MAKLSKISKGPFTRHRPKKRLRQVEDDSESHEEQIPSNPIKIDLNDPMVLDHFSRDQILQAITQITKSDVFTNTGN